ncbi:hypothetical protein BG004_003072 [Podila humilis]|nr:hypothetical protein BG004_003072 [Podila humilis]
MQIENSVCDYDAVESINLQMRKQLSGIINKKYFKFYKLNLYGTCPYWTENHFCTNEDCSVATIDDKTIPEEWTSAALSALSPPMDGINFQPFKSCQLKDQDFCQVDDEAKKGEGVYVDLTENPERFTGYSGPSAAKVWDAIYNENCFNVARKMQLASECEQCELDREDREREKEERQKIEANEGVSKVAPPVSSLFGSGGVGGGGAAAAAAAGSGVAKATNNNNDNSNNINRHMAHELTEDPYKNNMDNMLESIMSTSNPLVGTTGMDDEICLEKRVFYRMISGLHASISIHICDEYLNQTTGVWGPNLECFVSRVGAHPDRMENVYFDYSILVRAVTKLSGYLKNNEFCTGNPEEDIQVKAMVDQLIETSIKSPAIFDEKAMFVGPEAQALKLEFRDHFRNITKIMDCVGCEKCRLWGKVQTSGLGTALKVLFSYNDEHLNPIKHPNLLQRTEIVALFNTLNRLSESVESIGRFRNLYLQQHGIPFPVQPPQHERHHREHSLRSESNAVSEEQQPPVVSAVPVPKMGKEEHGKTAAGGQEEQQQVSEENTPVSSSSPSASTASPLADFSSTSTKTATGLIQDCLSAAGSCLERFALKLYGQKPMWFMFQNSGNEKHGVVAGGESNRQSKETVPKKKDASEWSFLFDLLPKTMATRVCPQPHPEEVDE